MTIIMGMEGFLIETIRRERALSRKDLAEMSGLAQETIREIEIGDRTARPATIRSIAEALEIDPRALTLESPDLLFAGLHEEAIKAVRQRDSKYSLEEAGRVVRGETGRAGREAYEQKRRAEPGVNAKMAVYPSPSGGEVEVIEMSSPSRRGVGARLASRVNGMVEALGGRVPEEALRELIDNLVHADYRGVVISVLENGDVVSVSDKGPGIEDKDRAFRFGYSGATLEALREIRGVGAGLGIARAATERAGGTVLLDDNIGGGTVATISMRRRAGASEGPSYVPVTRRSYPDAVPKMNISERQQKVLITVLESGEVGPSTVAEKLELSVSTAYRDLSVLEEHGLVTGTEPGKRRITPLGHDVVEAIRRHYEKESKG